MSDLLQDIDEALRREKAEKFWKENGPFILGGAVLLVIMTGVFTAYNTWKANHDAKQTAAIVAAMQQPKPVTALEDAAKSLKGQHRAMALLQVAGLKAQDGKTEDAVKLYQEIAAEKALPALWRDLATMAAVRAEWGKGVDAARAQTLFDQIKPLTAKTNPWHLQAAVQAAMIAGDSLGDNKTAIELLRDPISDPAAPAALKEKARILDQLYLNTKSKSEAKG